MCSVPTELKEIRFITEMNTIKSHNPAHVSPGLGWAVQSVAASVLSSSCGIPWEPQFLVITLPLYSTQEFQCLPAHQSWLKSIWALALWSNILNKEPCEAISWGVGYVWLSLKPFVTRTTGKTPASQRTYSLHFLVGFSIALKARVKIILKVGGEEGDTQKHDCTQPSETNVYMSQVFMSWFLH